MKRSISVGGNKEIAAVGLSRETEVCHCTLKFPAAPNHRPGRSASRRYITEAPVVLKFIWKLEAHQTTDPFD